MVCYTAYGLVVKSQYRLLLPSGPRQQVLAPRKTIQLLRGAAAEFSDVRKALNGHLRNRRWFQYARLDDGRDYLRWPKLFEFLITRQGRRILSRALTEIPAETFQTYLLTQVLSFALPRLGIEPLHATTVVMEGKAAAFLGDCGAGKSTLAAACLAAGGSLVTDDLLVLEPFNGRLLAYPGQARLKLMPSVARRLLGSQARGVAMNPYTSKMIIPLTATQSTSVPVPLQTVYVLHRRPRTARVAIRPLSRRAAWAELTGGTSNLALRDPARLRQQFNWTCQLVERLPVKGLWYPGTLRALPQVVKAIAADLARRSSNSSNQPRNVSRVHFGHISGISGDRIPQYGIQLGSLSHGSLKYPVTGISPDDSEMSIR